MCSFKKTKFLGSFYQSNRKEKGEVLCGKKLKDAFYFGGTAFGFAKASFTTPCI